MFGPKIKLERSDMVIRGFTYVLISVMALSALVPFVLIFASSFSSEDAIRLSGFTIWPKEFSTYAYELLFRSPKQIGGAYVLTISLTCVGTGFGLFIIAMTGYALQRRDFPFRNEIGRAHV
jgi:ABC-type glycerol-3-phosphate transport system permease component